MSENAPKTCSFSGVKGKGDELSRLDHLPLFYKRPNSVNQTSEHGESYVFLPRGANGR